jgi:riboflavin kinase/FMN adenylyltransferase
MAIFLEPQPLEFLALERAPARLMRFRDKVEALFARGIDQVCALNFNQQLSKLSAAEFIEQILVEELAIRHLVIGDDFRFGHDRKGDFDYLKREGSRLGFGVSDTSTYTLVDDRISSTRVRKALEDGDFAAAHQLLGQGFMLKGRVSYGKQLGQQIGFATANIRLHRFVSPLSGVYAVRLQTAAGQWHQGVANVGRRPTVTSTHEVVLEVHLFDFNQDIYGTNVSVEFFKKIRDEQKFGSIEELKSQIERDAQAARRYFEPN